MSIKAADVKELRKMTGAGMLDCKKALQETDGDFKKAVKRLKELGLAAVAKRSGRATNQGRIFTRITDTKAVILELTCETDFVARNKDFIVLGEKLIDVILEKGYTEINDELEDMVKDLISTIKENMSLKRFNIIDLSANQIASEYIHGEGSIGVIVALEAEDPSKITPVLHHFAFDCALHIAAFNPLYLDKTSVDTEYIKEQTEIFTKQVELLDKPANIIDNIVKGKINKHFTEICFQQQKFVKDDKISVDQAMKNVSKELGTSCKIVDYTYYKVGE